MPTPLKLIAGLGNPGSRYSQTRHNAGFWFADELAADYHCQFIREARFHGELARLKWEDGECYLFKPGVFMNESGRAVRALSHYYSLAPDTLLIVHDEIDLAPGTVRLKQGGGHGGHNGLRDIISHLDSRDFWRLRIGVGHPGHKDRVVNAVLSRPAAGERKLIDGAIARSLQVMPLILNGEFQKAMNELHTDNEQRAASDGNGNV